MLEIARQSVPDGYGNSYFWVKPPRIVPADLVRTVRGRLDHHGAEVRPVRRGRRPRGRPLLPRRRHHHGRRLLPARLRERRPRAARCSRCIAGRAPRLRRLDLQLEVLREYREYERSVTTLVDAAVKPKVGAYVTNIRTRLDEIAPRRAVLRDEEQRRRAVGRRGRAPADHHDAVRPGRRRPGRGADRRHRRLRPGAHLRRRRHLDRRHRRHRRRAGAHHRGLGRRLPVQDPDDRRRHRRRGRRLDRLALPRGHAQGRPQVGRRRPRPDVLPERRRPADRHRRPRHARPDPPAPAGRGDPAVGRRRRATAWRSSARSSTSPSSAPPPASSRSPRGTRPTRCAR